MFQKYFVLRLAKHHRFAKRSFMTMSGLHAHSVQHELTKLNRYAPVYLHFIRAVTTTCYIDLAL